MHQQLESPENAPPPEWWGWRWLLGSSSILILPVSLYVLFAAGIPRLIMESAVRADRPDDLPPPGLGDVSQLLTTQIVGAVGNGIALNAVLVIFGIAGVFACSHVKMSPTLTKYSWCGLAAAGVLGLWSVITATSDIRSFELMLR